MNSNAANSPQRPDQRLGQKYRFDDPNMDLFFVAALGWGPTVRLDIGQAFVSQMAKQRCICNRFAGAGSPCHAVPGAIQRKDVARVFLEHPTPNAPVVLVIGGADTSFDDLFFTAGRGLFDRGYSVALADLPGQGITQTYVVNVDADARHS